MSASRLALGDVCDPVPRVEVPSVRGSGRSRSRGSQAGMTSGPKRNKLETEWRHNNEAFRIQ
jgi:hypothetical protein